MNWPTSIAASSSISLSIRHSAASFSGSIATESVDGSLLVGATPAPTQYAVTPAPRLGIRVRPGPSGTLRAICWSCPVEATRRMSSGTNVSGIRYPPLLSVSGVTALSLYRSERPFDAFMTLWQNCA